MFCDLETKNDDDDDKERRVLLSVDTEANIKGLEAPKNYYHYGTKRFTKNKALAMAMTNGDETHLDGLEAPKKGKKFKFRNCLVFFVLCFVFSFSGGICYASRI